MQTELYNEQRKRWPSSGRYILAQFDEESIIVYQAYNPAIGLFAAKHQYFGGKFSYSRMSWIKTNFLWMMYRSSWGTKPNQEITLAIRLKRSFFDRIFAQAIVSNFAASDYAKESEWKTAVTKSNVRLQWDPDHSPTGAKLERKAVQLGLRRTQLQEYGREAILGITDISDFVSEQREHAKGKFEHLIMPSEHIYVPKSSA